MKKLITLVYLCFFGINTFAQITETCATGTIELKADNHQVGTLEWEKSKDGILWEKILNAHNITYTFETTEAAYYRAVNKFTSCEPQPSEVTFVQRPPVANAGQDRLINDTFVYLAANKALASTGTWTILEGAGGAFTNPANPNDKFTGILGNTYKLQWTLQNSCGTSSAIVNLNFVTNQYYSKIVIVDDTDTILSTPADLAAGNYNITFSSAVNIDDQTYIVGMVGNGFLRKVNTVTQNGNTFTMTTSQGKLEDILENGGFDLGNIFSLSQSLTNAKNANAKQNGYKLLSSKPTRAEILSNPKFQQGVHYFVMGEKESSVAGMRLKKTIENTGDDNFHFDFLDKKIIDEPALGVTMSLNGTMDFKPHPNAFYNRNIFNPIFSVSLDNATLVTKLTATLEVKGERELVNREFNLYNYRKIIAVMVGPLPVMITANVDLEGVSSVKVDGSIKVVHSITNTITTNAGIRYENGEWTNHYEDKIENTMDTSLDITGSLTQTFEIGPKVSFKVYDIIGPYVGARLTEDFSIRASNHNVEAINWDATLDLGANATVGVIAEGFGTTFFDCNQPLGNRSLYQIKFPNSIEYVTGNNQNYSFGVPMPEPVKVRVMSNKGFPVPGAMVTFAPAANVANNYVITDLNGYASTIWTASDLGNSSLTATVQDSELKDIEGGPIVFNATEDASLVCVDSSLRVGYITSENKISPSAQLGAPPYTYSTDGVNFSSLIPKMDLVPGSTYTATVRDTKGCKASINYYYPPLSCNNANLRIRLTAFGNNIAAVAQGGTPPYTYDLDRTGVFGTNEVFRAVSRGVHYITLKDAAGCTKEAGIYVTNSTAATIAYFKINNATNTAYSPISISNLSNNAATYLWNFGDGTTSIEANPSKTYTSAGTYTISLTATNASVQNVFSKTIVVAAAIPAVLPTVTIGTQVWTSKNLDVTTYSDGTPIPQVTDQTQWANLKTGAWCYYNNDAANGNTYGKLYNWYAVAGIHDTDPNTPNKKLAPTGYHIPTDAEWTTLTTFLDGESLAGGKMKSTGTSLWLSPNTNASNSSGFTGLPGGLCHPLQGFFYLGNRGQWWSSTEDGNLAYARRLNYDYNNTYRGSANRNFCFSVRCLRD